MLQQAVNKIETGYPIKEACTDCGATSCSISHAVRTYPKRLVIHVKKFGQGGKKKNGGISYNPILVIVGKDVHEIRVVVIFSLLDKVYNLDGLVIHDGESLKNGKWFSYVHNSHFKRYYSL